MEKTLEDYELERGNLEVQIASRKSKNALIAVQVDQLQTAYNKMKKIKDGNASVVKSDAKLDKVAGKVEWRGYSKNQFDSKMKDMVSPAAREFHRSIDGILDEIGTALAKKRGEYDTGFSLFNDLNKRFNEVVSTINNWFN